MKAINKYWRDVCETVSGEIIYGDQFNAIKLRSVRRTAELKKNGKCSYFVLFLLHVFNFSFSKIVAVFYRIFF